MAFTINLPSQPSSRANDSYKDGKPAEYEVKNATLLLFSGTSEDAAQFKSAYKLGTEPWKNNDPADDNISYTSKKVVQKVSQSITDAKALVVLNNNDIFTVDDNGELKFGDTKFAGTYKEFREKVSATQGKTLTASGFYMANAPLSSVAGGQTAPTGATVKTLTDLTGKIYDTEQEAKNGEAAQVYVERAVAKVTLQANSQTEADNGSTSKVAFELTGWAIDNYNPTTYLVRNTEGFDNWINYANENATAAKYRFVGGTAVAANLYRTYFAKDVNYDTDATLSRASSYSDKYGDDNPQYCFENTFNVKNQNVSQTTLVTLKAKLNNGSSFYIVGGDQTTLYTQDELVKLIKNKFLSTQNAWITANQKQGTTIDANDLTITFDKDAAGEIKVQSITVASEKLNDNYTALTESEIKAVSAAVGSIVYYKNGESYYTVRIKHFGDDQTPWKKGELGVAAGSIYPDTDNKAENNWLGRYGVLRNNWYDISVTGVKGLGSATVPEISKDKDTTDDELDSYIAVQINVLSWAKRTQSATLQ